MANHLALQLDRTGSAEMSCIAGVGGDVSSLVRTAKSGRPIIALDGCPLHCVAHILGRHGLAPTRHYDLSCMGVKKRAHEDFDRAEAVHLLDEIEEDLRALRTGDSPGTEPPRANSTPVCGLAESGEI